MNGARLTDAIFRPLFGNRTSPPFLPTKLSFLAPVPHRRGQPKVRPPLEVVKALKSRTIRTFYIKWLKPMIFGGWSAQECYVQLKCIFIFFCFQGTWLIAACHCRLFGGKTDDGHTDSKDVFKNRKEIYLSTFFLSFSPVKFRWRMLIELKFPMFSMV